MNTMKELDLIKMMIDAIQKVEERMNNEVGYAVYNEDYVKVGKDYEYKNEMAFNNINAAQYASIYNNKEDAYKFVQDFHLINKYGTDELQIVDSKEYFASVIRRTYELIEYEVGDLKNKLLND